MEKPYDNQLSYMSKNQLIVLRVLLTNEGNVLTTRAIAKKTGVVEKQLGGVLSALSRKRVQGMSLIELMGRDEKQGLRWKLNARAITVALAINKVKALILSFR